MSAKLTKHAETRMNQRGFRERDIDLILRYGTECKDGVILEGRMVNRRVMELKREMAALERLAGSYAVTDGKTVKTVYRAGRRKRRAQLRHH
jgi:hypothetical protein